MASFRDFDRYILPFMSAVPLPSVDDALRDAAIEFCERAKVLTATLEDQIAVGPEVEIEPDDNTLLIAEPREVWGPGGLLTPKTIPQLDSLFPHGWQAVSVDNPARLAFWHAPAKNLLRLVPYPVGSVALRVKVALKPKRDAEALPDGLLAEHAEIIAAGAMGRLHQQIGTYAVPEKVGAYLGKFEAAIRDLSEHLDTGWGRPQLRTGQDELL